MTTFISFIGKGAPERDGKYRYKDVTYHFDALCIDASCFAAAVIQSGKYHFDRVCIIGTESSTWGQLLENPSAEEEDLFLEVFEGAPLEKLELLKPRLQQALQKRWNIPEVRLFAHSEQVSGNEDAILNGYLELMLECSGDIVLDVTHGFRWMPQFLTSVMQLADVLSEARNVKLLYGELSQDRNNCPVRELDAFWQTRKLAGDVQLFFEKFEGGPLAEQLRPYWPSGADAILSLSRMLQGNYIVPLVFGDNREMVGLPLRQLSNAFAALEKKADVPLWVLSVRKRLLKIFRHIESEPRPSRRLLALAELYAERHFYGQALICQESALRLFLWEHYSSAREIPNWEDLKKAVKWYQENPNTRLTEQYWMVLNNRNVIAHGALRSPGKAGGVPQPSNLAAKFQSQQKFLGELLSRLL